VNSVLCHNTCLSLNCTLYRSHCRPDQTDHAAYW
jgi:hypothetical protein